MSSLSRSVTSVFGVSCCLRSSCQESHYIAPGRISADGHSQGPEAATPIGEQCALSNVTYEPFGAVNGWTWGNGTYEVRTYDQDGKISQVDGSGLKTYGYDDAFRIIGIADTVNSAFSWTYGYDALDRLSSASATGQSQSFTYDATGNRLTQGGTLSSTYTVSAGSNRRRIMDRFASAILTSSRSRFFASPR